MEVLDASKVAVKSDDLQLVVCLGASLTLVAQEKGQIGYSAAGLGFMAAISARHIRSPTHFNRTSSYTVAFLGFGYGKCLPNISVWNNP